MSCCCPHDLAAARCFSAFAPLYRWRFRRGRLERTQRQLVAGLEAAGVLEGAALLEVGCGVGHLHQLLLARHGAARATGVDLAPRMIAEARRLAAERGLGERTEYHVGDYLALADALGEADVAILDKVVCCHPEGVRVLAEAARRARRAVALTYPRDRLAVRAGARLVNAAMALARSAFRVYVHPPAALEAALRGAGLRRATRAQTAVWRTEVWSRAPYETVWEPKAPREPARAMLHAPVEKR